MSDLEVIIGEEVVVTTLARVTVQIPENLQLPERASTFFVIGRHKKF